MLLDKGAEINAQGGHFGSALQAASDRGRDKVVQLLIDHGAKINAKELDQTLRLAKIRGYDKMVQLLRNHEAALRWEPLITEEAEETSSLSLRKRLGLRNN